MSQNALMAYHLRGEKDTRPYWETQHRGMVLPLVQSGYNNSVDYGVPGILGGSAWGVLNDIIEGRQVAKGEIEQGATDGAGAAMVGSLAFGKPRGAIGSGGGREQALPMDQASRMARAKEMGFDTENVMYHGTTSDFASFRPSRGDEAMGGGVYLSPDTKMANMYADTHDGMSGRVLPLYVKGGKYFDTAKQSIDDIVPGSSASASPYHLGDNAGQIAKRLADDGYLGIRQTFPEGQTQVSVFDPRNIRSVNAAFDPAMADSANLLAANAPTSAAAPSLQQIGRQAAQDAVPGIRAYHGSPHDFDKFDLSKIGTGEGAQAYGHGLYFAENEGVAKSYRDTLSPYGKLQTDSGVLDINSLTDEAKKIAAFTLKRYPEAHDAKYAAGNYSLPNGVTREQVTAAIDELVSQNARNPGRMYEVNIKADPNDFLDWDKPLSQQPAKVVDLFNERLKSGGIATRSIGKRNDGTELFDVYQKGGGSFGVFPGDRVQSVLDRPADYYPATGRDLKESLGLTEDVLREAGIPGIKYLDQGSRGAGEGSRNYVVFDDALVEILRKYGLAGLAALGAAGATNNDASAQPRNALRP